MTKKVICLICGENISIQMDLNELTISTDCKNEHHIRKIPFNTYYNFLPNSIQDIINFNKKNNYVFYCYTCQKNVDLENIKEHNKHDGIKLSLNEFLSQDNRIEFNSCIKHKNFDKYLNQIDKVINDFKEWKQKLDKKCDIYIQFLENLHKMENYFFDELLIQINEQDKELEDNIFYKQPIYDYELLINLKEIYRINNNVKKFLNDYNNNTNFSKLSYFFINKLKDINEEEKYLKETNIESYYKGNLNYFNEEIYYKEEKKDNIFPLIKNLFKTCKHFVGYDPRYFNENGKEHSNINELGDPIFHKFLFNIKSKFPHINHISLMRNKSYFSCSVSNQIIIIKNNKNQIEIINQLNCDNSSNNNLSKANFSLELTNKLFIGITENKLLFFKFNEPDNKKEEFYKSYKIIKSIKILEKIDDIIQVSPKLFCTFFQKTKKLCFWDIKYMEIISIIGDIKTTPNNSYYIHMLNNSSLLITGTNNIYILSIDNMILQSKIQTNGLISAFCLLPKNGILCAEIDFNYGPNNPFLNGDNEYNIVQYQINGKEIKKISEKKKVHKDIIRSLFYLGNNVILSCSTKDELKIWY